MKVLLDLEEEINRTNQVWEKEENQKKEDGDQNPEKLQNLSTPKNNTIYIWGLGLYL